MAFFKNSTFVFDTIFFSLAGLAEPSVYSQDGFFKSHWIVDKEGTISAAKSTHNNVHAYHSHN